MLSAKEARQKSETIYNKKVDDNYSALVNCVDDAITKAVDNGDKKTSVNIASHIISDAIMKLMKTLEDLGYSADQKFQSGIRTIYINWGDA